MNEFDRLQQTWTFRDGGIDLWTQTHIGLIGVGNLGSPLAVECVRSGASVIVWDMDVGSLTNTVTQRVQPGVPKVQTIVDECNRLRLGSAVGFQQDIRHAGVSRLRECDVLVDATDDPALAYHLTEISNGLEIPLVRMAVEGSGQREFGRVLCSHGSAGHACQLCSWTLDDLGNSGVQARMPCQDPERPPTLAGNAISLTVVAVALLQIQRLVTGNDCELALDHEIFIDLNSMQLLPMRLPVSDACLSGHQRWELTEVASHTVRTYGQLFDYAGQLLGTDEFAIEPYLHPLCLEAFCECGNRRPAVGTIWSEPPLCRECPAPMQWHKDVTRASLRREQAALLGLLECTLQSTGMPESGGLYLAYAPNRPTLRLLVTDESHPSSSESQSHVSSDAQGVDRWGTRRE